MAHSMTAFASREANHALAYLRLEIKSVNHRFLEFTPKLPDEFKSYEPMLRERAQRVMQRGKVDLFVRYKANATSAQLALNEALVEQLITLASNLHDKHPELKPLATADVLLWPGVMQAGEADSDALKTLFFAELDQLLMEFDQARQREGSALALLLRERLQALAALRLQAIALMPQIRSLLREKWEQKTAEIKATLDAARWEAELTLLLQKMDVDEELDRLRVHIEEMQRVLSLQEPIGRRLDFLVQELHRECNTFGAKSADARTSQLCIDMKVLVEQMREQLQNLE
jgi:uncharacterized protein (TIGR00255 family)